MMREAVYHKTGDQYCYQRNRDELVINIKTGYDVKSVTLYYGDPFEAGILGGHERWSGRKLSMVREMELSGHIWWSARVKPEYKRCKYYFELSDGKEALFYFENGFLTKDRLCVPGVRLQHFVFPWMNGADLNVTPAWVKDTVWYQIFPERFCNGDKSNDPRGAKPWKSERPGHYDCYGGDLQGVIDRLDYLKELGITGIYFNPLFEASTTHKYDTADYMKIDPSFGDNALMKKLCEQAHRRGIKIMLDAVFNHCGTSFAPWRDVLENGERSKYRDWFMINEFPVDDKKSNTRDGRYFSFAFSNRMPKLNTNNSEVAAYFCKVCEYWMTQCGVDGFRFDVANEVSHDFLRTLRKHVKAINPDVYLLGEIWHDSTKWLQGDELDAVMNYPLTEAISGFWLEPSLTRRDFAYSINRCRAMYMEQTNDALFNLLDSHDTERLIYRTKDENVFYQQLAILFTLQGSPCIYYGTEVVLEGGPDPDCRRCMPWDGIDAGKFNGRLETMKALIRLRGENPCFKSGELAFVETKPGNRVIEYVKTDGRANRVKVTINAGQEKIALNEQKVLFERLYDGAFLMPGGVCISAL